MQRNITATIITLNEEKHIREVIENVQNVCDEVVVVDSFSTDKTSVTAVKKPIANSMQATAGYSASTPMSG